MSQIEQLMALADEYMRWGGKDRDRLALRAAIEQALVDALAAGRRAKYFKEEAIGDAIAALKERLNG